MTLSIFPEQVGHNPTDCEHIPSYGYPEVVLVHVAHTLIIQYLMPLQFDYDSVLFKISYCSIILICYFLLT